MDNFILKIINNSYIETYINDIKNNNEYYKQLEKNINNNINGRICHHRIKILHAIFRTSNFNSYLEIGVHNGASMSYVVSNNKLIKCYGIDLFEDTNGTYKSIDNINISRTKCNIEKNNKVSEINLIKANTFENTTVTNLKNLINGKVDILLIDGDHSYEGIKNDFIKYTEFVKPNGLIILDDFYVKKINSSYKYPGIMKFVYEYINNNSKYRILGIYDNTELIILKV